MAPVSWQDEPVDLEKEQNAFRATLKVTFFAVVVWTVILITLYLAIESTQGMP